MGAQRLGEGAKRAQAIHLADEVHQTGRIGATHLCGRGRQLQRHAAPRPERAHLNPRPSFGSPGASGPPSTHEAGEANSAAVRKRAPAADMPTCGPRPRADVSSAASQTRGTWALFVLQPSVSEVVGIQKQVHNPHAPKKPGECRRYRTRPHRGDIGDTGTHLCGRLSSVGAVRSHLGCRAQRPRLRCSHALLHRTRLRGRGDRRSRPLRADRQLPAPPARADARPPRDRRRQRLHRRHPLDCAASGRRSAGVLCRQPRLRQASNRGVAAAGARWWYCSTTTSTCQPDFLERLVAPLQDDPQVGSVAALMLQPGER